MDLMANMDALTKEMGSLRSEICELKETIQLLTKTITCVPEPSKTPKRKCKIVKKKLDSRFPIKTQEQLDQLESDISDDNRDELIQMVQRQLGVGGLIKNLTHILSIDLVLEYNVGGIHRKKRLQNYSNLLSLLFAATNVNDGTYKAFLDDLRVALRCAKNKHFKNVCVRRRKQRLELRTEYVDVNEAVFPD